VYDALLHFLQIDWILYMKKKLSLYIVLFFVGIQDYRDAEEEGN
jgi:hypothetical protein